MQSCKVVGKESAPFVSMFENIANHSWLVKYIIAYVWVGVVFGNGRAGQEGDSAGNLRHDPLHRHYLLTRGDIPLLARVALSCPSSITIPIAYGRIPKQSGV